MRETEGRADRVRHNLKVFAMKLTKKMQQTFERYQIALRDSNTTVTHQVTGEITDCPPIVFALFELVVKCQYVGGSLCPDPQIADFFMSGSQILAARNGITLVAIDTVTAKQVQSDNLWAVGKVREAGYYFQLLD